MSKHGRPASPLTQAMRQVLRNHRYKITFSEATEELKAAGVDVTQDGLEQKFNMRKYLDLGKDKVRRQGKNKAAEVPPPKHRTTDLASAVKFVTDGGGLAKVQEALKARRLALEQDEALVGVFQNIAAQVRAAS